MPYAASTLGYGVVQGFSDDVRCGFITRTAESTTKFTELRGLAKLRCGNGRKNAAGRYRLSAGLRIEKATLSKNRATLKQDLSGHE